MRIEAAFPKAFEKAYPAIDPKAPMILVLPLLRFHDIDALILSLDSKRHRGIFGFSCLARILSLGPERFPQFLKEKCEDVSEPVATVSADQALGRLLDTFLETRFGFVRVVERKGIGAVLTLNDVLELYGTGAVSSKMEVREVASRIISLPESSSLRSALEEMFRSRCRRIFISGKREFVWDRGVVDYLFSPAVLAKVARDPAFDPLVTPLSQIGRTEAEDVDPDMSLKAAAAVLGAERGQCLVFDDRVATPWDVVMKPWKDHGLRVRSAE